MAHGHTRWGILSSGLIAQDFTMALTSLLSEDHKVVAIAARKKQDAEEFAKRYGIPKAYEGYDGLEKDPDIDVVYIGCIHTHHAEQSKRMLQAGKHVLCEKPAAVNSRELEEVLDVARQTGKFFMEGFWSRCFPVYDKLRQELTMEPVGDVKHVSVEFGGNILHIQRVSQRSMGGGALLDVGCYCIQFADLVLGPNMPDTISATGILTADNVDEAVSITLIYPGKKMAVLTVSAGSRVSRRATIGGTKDIIEIPMMWCPEEISLPSGKQTFKLPDASGYHYTNSQGLMYEAQEVRECLTKGLLESPKVPHRSSKNIMAIMDEVRRQIGVVYDADK